MLKFTFSLCQHFILSLQFVRTVSVLLFTVISLVSPIHACIDSSYVISQMRPPDPFSTFSYFHLANKFRPLTSLPSNLAIQTHFYIYQPILATCHFKLFSDR